MVFSSLFFSRVTSARSPLSVFKNLMANVRAHLLWLTADRPGKAFLHTTVQKKEKDIEWNVLESPLGDSHPPLFVFTHRNGQIVKANRKFCFHSEIHKTDTSTLLRIFSFPPLGSTPRVRSLAFVSDQPFTARWRDLAFIFCLPAWFAHFLLGEWDPHVRADKITALQSVMIWCTNKKRCMGRGFTAA